MEGVWVGERSSTPKRNGKVVETFPKKKVIARPTITSHRRYHLDPRHDSRH